MTHIVEFHRAYRRAAPLMLQLGSAQEAQAAAESELEALDADLRKVDRQLAAHQGEFKHCTAARAADELEVQAALKRLKLAERLHQGLSDELARWSTQVVQDRRGVGGGSIFFLKNKRLGFPARASFACKLACVVCFVCAVLRSKLCAGTVERRWATPPCARPFSPTRAP